MSNRRSAYPKIYHAFIGATLLASGFQGLVPTPTSADVGKVLSADGTWITVGGTGTVTSVGLSLPAIFAVAGSPVTTTGTLAATLATQASNLVFAGPVSGAAASPTFRALDPLDIPNLAASKITSGTIATARLGTGVADATTFLRGDQTYAVPPATAAAGSNQQIQYNYAGAFAGSADFTWDNTNGYLTIQPTAVTNNSTIYLYNTTTNTTDVGEALEIIQGSTGTPGSGFGNQIGFYAKTTTTNAVTQALLQAVWSTATHVSRTSDVRFFTVNAATLAESFRILASTNGIRIGSTTNYVGIKPSGAGTTTYALPATDGTSGYVLSTNGSGVLSWIAAGGTGTVTSVALSLPAMFSVSGSPVTTTGTLTATLATQTANLVFAGPASGAAAAPTFRALDPLDIPNISAAKLTSGTVATARLGTGVADITTFLRGDQTWATPGGGGTVTSVALSLPAIFSVSGSPVTSSGTLTATLATQVQRTFFMGPDSGPDAAPTFRTIVATDLGTGTADVTTVLAGNLTWVSLPTGTVTSVALSLPAIFSVTGSPVTSSGTLTATLATQTANLVFAGPVSGAAAAPTFRALDPLDIPNISASKITSGTVATARLGSGVADITTYLRGDQTWATTPTGTVTSVALSLPAIFSVTGSPVTTTGTLTATLATQTANLVFAGPASGAAAAPTFRALDPLDIPNLAASKITSGTIDTARLGSGVADATTFLRGDQTYAVPPTAPAGSTTQVQFNNAGTLAGSSGMTWDNTNGALTLASVSNNTNPVLVVTSTTTNTNDVQEVMRVRANSSGTPTTNYGMSIGLYGESSTTDNMSMLDISAQWSVVTHASRNSVIIFKAMVSGTSKEVLRLNDSQNGGASNAVISATNLIALSVNQTISSNGTVSGGITSSTTVSATGSHGSIYGTTTLNSGMSTTAAQTGIKGAIATGTSSATLTNYLSAGVLGTSSQAGSYGVIGQLTQANTATGTGAAILAYISGDTNNNSSTLRVIEVSRQGGTPATGYGGGIYFSLSSSVQARDAALISSEWSTHTDASRTSVIKFATVNSASALTTRFQIDGGGALTSTTETATTNAAVTVLTFAISSTGTAATGFGHNWDIQAETSTTNAQNLGSITWTWSDGTHATRTGAFVLSLQNSASSTQVLAITGAGTLNLPQATQTIAIGGTQVLGARKLGWSAWTGTKTRTSVAVGSATVADVAAGFAALLDDIISHGIVGA